MNRVLILGGGPSGLMSAWAALKNGWEVVLADKRQPDPTAINAGVFILHDDLGIPSLPSVCLQTTVMGAPEHYTDRAKGQMYSEKVYGTPLAPNSLFKYIGSRMAFDPVKAMTFALDLITSGGGRIISADVGEGIDAVNFLADREDADAIISTIPLTTYVDGGPPSESAFVYTGVAPAEEAFMLYNVAPHTPWYRSSAAFGRFTMEYAPGRKPADDPRARAVTKVLPWPEREAVLFRLASASERPILFTGRFGAWSKDVLVDDTFREAERWLNQLWK